MRLKRKRQGIEWRGIVHEEAMRKRKVEHKIRSEKKTKKRSVPFFDSLVSNGIEFLGESITDLKNRPKYSVINFCSGLEIILKARLLQEHWSLILKKPEDASVIHFETGNFISVTMEEAIKRLQNVVGQNFSIEESRCFQKLRDHRNKVVHFFHNAYSKKASDTLLQEIVAEQCKAWFHLHQKLTGSWSEHFGEHQKVIAHLDKAFHGHRVFLKAKFVALKPNVDKETSDGIEFKICKACGFHSARVNEVTEPLVDLECVVCGAGGSSLLMPCPKCGTNTEIYDLANAICDNEECNSEISLADVISKYGPSYDPRDGEDSPLSYCACCEYPEETVIPLDDKYLCLWCIQWYDLVENCAYCGTSLVGFDPDGSYINGCFLCETAAREHFDRMM